MTAPELSVVVCSLGRTSATAAIASVLASLTAAGVEGEVVLVWQDRTPPEGVPDGVRVVPCIRAGVSHARNVGVEASRSARIAQIDDDERVAESWAAGALRGFEEGADAVFGPVEPDGDGRPHGALGGDSARWIAPDERPWRVGASGNMAASRETLARVGGFDPRLGPGSFGLSAEDAFLIARLQRAGARLRWRPEMRVSHPTKTDAEVLASSYPGGFGAGRIVRRLRSPGLAARYGADLGSAAREAARRRSPQRTRELVATARGFAAGALLRDRWVAPAAVLELMPDEIAAELLGHRPRGLPVPHRRDPHFLYAVGNDRLLHVYGEGGPEKEKARRVRQRLREVGLTRGIPELYAAVETTTELWVVEERLPGRAAATEAAPPWWGTVTGLLVEMARRTPGGPVRAAEPWEELAAWLAPRWRGPVLDALQIVGDLPGVVTHTDVQPKNIVVDGDAAGLVDWDGAFAEGLPGLDLLFLAVTARTGGPEAEPLLALAEGRDVPGVPLLASLEAAGLTRANVCAAALVAAGTWAAAEAERAARPFGLDVAPPSDFARLLDEAGPALVAAQPSRPISA